jgi:hypothetical protein
MKRSFRVATVFTGAAACAAAFTPGVATAATAKADLITPDIAHKNCPHTPALTKSVHFYYPPSAKHGPTCVAGDGKTSLGGTVYSFICTGNNFGWYDVNGSINYFNKHSLISLPPNHRIYAVDIQSTGGSWACSYNRP